MRKHTEDRRTRILPDLSQPGPEHRAELARLEDDAEGLVRVAGALQGATTTQTNTSFDLVGLKVARSEIVESYRSANALAPAQDAPDADWVSVKPNTRLSTLVKKHGSRLLGFDKMTRSFTVTVLFWNLVDAESNTARALVRRDGDEAAGMAAPA